MRMIEFPALGELGPSWVGSLHFGPASDTLASVCWIDDGRVAVEWADLRTGEVGSVISGASLGEDAYPPAPVLSPDHRFLARMANQRGGVEYLELIDRHETRKGKGVRPLTAWPFEEYGGDPQGLNYQRVAALAFAPDGEHLYAAIAGGDPEDDIRHLADLGFYRWNVAAAMKGRGKKSAGDSLPDAKFFIPFDQPDTYTWGKRGTPLAVSPDGATLACGLWDKYVRLWDLTGEPRPEPKRKKRKTPLAWRLAFSPDSKTLAFAHEEVTLLDVATGTPRAILPPGPPVTTRGGKRPFVSDLAYHPTEPLLATVNCDSVVRWWDGTTGAERGSFDWEIQRLSAVAFSPDGNLCAAAGWKGRVAVWDVGV